MKQIKIYSILLLTVWLFSGCSTIKVDTDYDPEFSFDKSATFAVVHKVKAGSDTLTADRIIEAINSEMKTKNYTKTSKDNADLYIFFHINVTNKTQIVQDYQYVGYSPYRYGYGGMMAVPTTRAYNYEEGKLILDVINPKDKKVVWRGIARDSLKQYDNPQERTAYIHKVISSVLKSFPVRSATR